MPAPDSDPASPDLNPETATGGPRFHLHALGRDAGIYGLGGALVQAVGLLTVPVFARELGVAEYGRLEFLVAMTALVVSACGDAMGAGMARSYVDQAGSPRRLAVVRDGLRVVLVMAVLGGVVIAGLALVAGAGIGASTAVLAAMSVPPAVVSRYWADTFRVARRPWAFLTTSLIRGLLAGGVGITLVLARSGSAGSVLGGVVVGSTGATLVGWVLVGSLSGRDRSGSHVREIVRFGLPLIPVAVSGWSLMLVDRLVIARFESAAPLGEYAVANRLVSLLLLIVYSVGTAWTPYAMRLGASNPDAEGRLRPIVLRIVLVAVGCVAVSIACVAPELVRLLAGSAYGDAARVVPTLAGALVLFAAVPVLQTPLLLARRTRAMAVASLVAAGVNLLSCMSLVPAFGLQGAALASALGFVAQAVLFLHFGQGVQSVTYPGGRLALALGLPMTWLALAWRLIDLEAGAVPRVALAAAFPLAVVGTRLIGVADVRRVLRQPGGGARA